MTATTFPETPCQPSDSLSTTSTTSWWANLNAPVITFLNGLTQNAKLWKNYADYFVPRGYRVLAYDMLGQGRSCKPVIDIKLTAHADMASLLDELDIKQTHLASISFGGIIALDFAIGLARTWRV